MLPGDDAIRDAGLSDVDPHEPWNLAEAQEQEQEQESADRIAERDTMGDQGHGAQENRPGIPRPDLRGEASEADVLDQAVVVPLAEDDDFPA